MGTQLNLNAVNQVAKGSIIFQENEDIYSICLILKGKVTVQRNGIMTTLGAGNFLGVCDIYEGRYAMNYTAEEDLMIYAFPANEKEDIGRILSSNKEYSGLMVASLSNYIKQLSKIYAEVTEASASLYNFLAEYYQNYSELGRETGYATVPIPMLESLEPLQLFDQNNHKKIDYYKACAEIPLDVQKPFYSRSNIISLYHVEEQVELVNELLNQCTEVSCHISELSLGLISDDDFCLFKCFAKLGMEINRGGMDSRKANDFIDQIVEKINEVEKLFKDKIGIELGTDRERMENIYYMLVSGKETTLPKSRRSDEKKEFEGGGVLRNSLETLLNYSELDEGVCNRFKELIQEFKKMKDKFSSDDRFRKIRMEITSIFYQLYEAVFKKSYKNNEDSPVVNLFLKFGFVDETLLSEEQLCQLYNLEENEVQTGPCNVYNIKEWLTLIYEGKKEPSKNEFDLDYQENLRELKKSGMLTDEQVKTALTDIEKKLQFEIANMFKYNNRIVSTQITTFVPVLFEEMFIGSLEKSYLTAGQVNASVNRLRMVDYSVFYREVLYTRPEKGINKENIMLEVFPDIILLPTRGVSCIMWQEISGRKRNTEGRFIMPSFVEGNVDDMIIKAFGRFRWELCRTVQGASWNNIKIKSLTSEYMDYIQFYRKNKDLSEVRKEKLKAQIQKSRNNTREVFVSDYEIWIKNESKGALRLNKTVRELMALYVPFSISIRKKLSSQPLYEEAMGRFTRERLKKAKEIDLRYRTLEKEEVELPEELLTTRKFYTDM